MARPRKVVQIPPGEAAFILETMILDGRINPKTLAEYRGRYLDEISSIEARLARLRDLSSPAVSAVLGAAAAAAAPSVARAVRRAAPKVRAKAKKAVAKLTPERIKARELQGRYLGLMRQIPRGVVNQRFGKDAIKEKGKEAVIEEMKKFIAQGEGGTRSKKSSKKR
jgi:hypothetical protein